MTLSCSATDATSDVASISYGTQTATQPGSTTLDCTATDNAGNTSSYSLPIIIDSGLPNLQFSINGNYCSGGWYNTPVHAYVILTDADSGPGSYTFQVDGQEWDGSREIKDGLHTISATGWDIAGNQQSISATVKIDTLAPDSSWLTENGSWVAGKTTLKGQSIDPMSGISLVEISFDGGKTWIPVGHGSPWSYAWDTLSKETPVADGSYQILARAKDNACNQEGTAHLTINVDNTPPDIALQNSFNLMGDSTAIISSDAGSGVATVKVTISGNGIVPRIFEYTSPGKQDLSWDGRDGNSVVVPFGSYNILVEVWDKVGNYAKTSGIWVRPRPKAPVAPAKANPLPAGNGAGATALTSGSTAKPSAGRIAWVVPIWILVLPMLGVGIWLVSSGIALIRDRRWVEVRGIRNSVSGYLSIRKGNQTAGDKDD